MIHTFQGCGCPHPRCGTIYPHHHLPPLGEVVVMVMVPERWDFAHHIYFLAVGLRHPSLAARREPGALSQ